MPASPHSVLVVSRSPAYAEGVAGFLSDEGFRTGLARTVEDVLARLDEDPRRILIVDEWVEDASAAELAFEVRRRHPDLRILFAVDDDALRGDVQVDALAAGASGCILRSFPREEVVEAVVDALRGLGRFDVDALRTVIIEGARTVAPVDDLGLTDQERVVLRYMRQRLTYKEIALAIGVSWHTVRTQAQSILRKHGVHSRRELDAWDPQRRARGDEPDYAAMAG